MTDDDMKKECFNCEFYSYGTKEIFEERMRTFSRRLKVITFLGLLSPVLLGAFAASFSSENEIFKTYLVPICGLIAIAQAIISLMSLVGKWDDRYSNSISAAKANSRLEILFKKAKNLSGSELKSRYEMLHEEFERQDASDISENITVKEKRYAYRKSLFQYKSVCKTCGLTPKVMKPSSCDSCGNF